MKNCMRCGAGNDDNAAVCAVCGEPFAAEQYVTGAPSGYGQVPDGGGGYEETGNSYGEGSEYRYGYAPVEGDAWDYGYVPQYEAPQYEIVRKRRARNILIKAGSLVLVALLLSTTFVAIRFIRRIPDPVSSTEKPVRIDILSEPEQVAVENMEPFRNGLNGSVSEPRAAYTIQAKVLDVLVNTKFGDVDGPMPIDLALIWGKVAETDYKKYLKYSFDRIWKRNQWLQFELKTDEMPEGTGPGDLMTHVSNNHIIPANENIYNAVAHLKKDEEVLLSGYLVDVTDIDGNVMRTSLKRTDTDAGACECFYVDRVQYGGKVYK